jgi:hypothetical protein
MLTKPSEEREISKVRAFTWKVAHAGISIWKTSHGASQYYESMEVIDKYNTNNSYPAKIMKIACSTHVKRVCVKTLIHKVCFLQKWQETTRFSRQERKSETDKPKVKPYNLLGPRRPHLIYPPKWQYIFSFTWTMKVKVKILLAHRGQGRC